MTKKRRMMTGKRFCVILGMVLAVGVTALGDAHNDLLLRIIGQFGRCMTGPGGNVPSKCETLDKDGDGNIDLKDWALMEARRDKAQQNLGEP